MAPNETGRRHSRDDVAEAALRILDDLGLPDLTMRRLAASLDVQPSALYWHFRSKQELLAELADRITADVPADDADVSATARGIRDALFTYRDGAELVLSTYALQLGSRHAHSVLERALGDRPDRTDRATALLHFILGHATLVQQRMHADSYGAAATGGSHDPTAGLDEVFDLGVRALAGSVSEAAPRPHGRA